MKQAKRFGNDYYFIGYSPSEIEEYILEHPPNTIRTKTGWSSSYTVCTFKDVDAWTRHWLVVEMLSKERPK